MSSVARQPAVMRPFFLSGSAGRLFALYLGPNDVRPDVVAIYCPPFAEEMNKSRRMARLQAERFALLGIGVLFVDLYGTGDSEGEFAEANWEIWLDDIDRAVQWLRSQGVNQVLFWGLRVGALLAVVAARSCRSDVSQILLWQPVVQGRMAMAQFLRLRVAAEMMKAGVKITTKEVSARLAAGETMEIAGYELAPLLFDAINQLDLSKLVGADLPPIFWADIASNTDRSLNVASQRAIDSCHNAGAAIDLMRVCGDAFWNTPEIALVPELLDVTTDAVRRNTALA